MPPAQIAARLTPAQRRALLGLPGDGECTDGLRAPRGMFGGLQRMALLNGLCSVGGGWGWHITPLGQAVRAVIAQEGRDG